MIVLIWLLIVDVVCYGFLLFYYRFVRLGTGGFVGLRLGGRGVLVCSRLGARGGLVESGGSWGQGLGLRRVSSGKTRPTRLFSSGGTRWTRGLSGTWGASLGTFIFPFRGCTN